MTIIMVYFGIGFYYVQHDGLLLVSFHQPGRGGGMRDPSLLTRSDVVCFVD